jgi:hypothetical protein
MIKQSHLKMLTFNLKFIDLNLLIDVYLHVAEIFYEIVEFLP